MSWSVILCILVGGVNYRIVENLAKVSLLICWFQSGDEL